MKTIIFGGTTEGREQAALALARGESVLVSVTSEYARQFLPEGAACHIGALDEAAMKAWIAAERPERGMVQSHVIAMQGPFSRDFNAALYDQLRIRTMVSKDSGQPGGVADKVLPALERGIDVVMIERPKEDKR